ncbi:MAG: PKD domain-containing protein [Bacteroidetes bacterium]|nr:PKD domain-containing protein [Bacteroidota bacterium]
MNKYILLSLLSVFAFSACKKVRPTLGDPPKAQDATFVATPSDSNANIIELSANNPNLVHRWDFGNGMKGEGSNVSAIYPYAGTYTITLTVFNKGGSRSSSQQVVIAQTDLGLLDNPFYNKLTGGANGPGYKTWVIDSVLSGHFGVGPDPESPLGATPEWWAAGANEKPGCGLYDDKYVFHLNAFKFDMITNGDIYLHNSLAASFPGSFQNLGDFTAPYANQMDKSWNLVEGPETTITLSNGAFIGFYTGVNTYRILELTDTTMYLQYGHHAGGLNWYLKLKVE